MNPFSYMWLAIGTVCFAALILLEFRISKAARLSQPELSAVLDRTTLQALQARGYAFHIDGRYNVLMAYPTPASADGEIAHYWPMTHVEPRVLSTLKNP